MSRPDLRGLLASAALLLVPAALSAQGSDSGAANAAKKAKDPAASAQVICRDGTTGSGAQGCAGHGGVDAVTTSASQTGRVSHGPVETGEVDPGKLPSGHAGLARDTTVRVKPPTDEPTEPQRPSSGWPGDSTSGGADGINPP